MLIELVSQLNAVCPVHGVAIGRRNDKSTWRIDFKDEATEAQRRRAQQVLEGFELDMTVPEAPAPVEPGRVRRFWRYLLWKVS